MLCSRVSMNDVAGRAEDDFGSRYLSIESEIGVGIILHSSALPI